MYSPVQDHPWEERHVHGSPQEVSSICKCSGHRETIHGTYCNGISFCNVLVSTSCDFKPMKKNCFILQFLALTFWAKYNRENGAVGTI